MSDRRIHVRKVVVFDYELKGEQYAYGYVHGDGLVDDVESELEDQVGTAIDAYLNPLDAESFFVQECEITVIGEEMSSEDEERLNLVSAQHLGTPGVQVHRRPS